MRKTKRAFSMVTAIFVIFIMSSITALIMGVTSKTVKATTQQYQKEQASLLARSYTELAMLYVLNYNRNSSSCIETIDATFGDPNNLYTIKTNIQYIGNSQLFPNGCSKNITPSWSVANPTGFDASLSLIIDVYITYKDFDDPIGRDTTFFRRTVQKL
jgi:type II secretory pathway pseudopilin PulG